MEAKPVLIVDDEKNIRQTLSQALESLDLETATAVNGEEALAQLEEKPFGLILLDLKMPGMDGMEVLRQVREMRPDIKVIIITAYGTVESAVEAMKLGAVDFIEKPFAPKDIRDLVQKVLDRESLEAEAADDYESHIELAKRCITEREFGAAREHVKQAIAIDASKAEAFNLMGVLQEIGGDRLEALKSYRAALSIDPTYKPADQNLDRAASMHPDGKFVLEEKPDQDEEPEEPLGNL
ncbi:MAG: response regulator [Phycisphaerae bacterium]